MPMFREKRDMRLFDDFHRGMIQSIQHVQVVCFEVGDIYNRFNWDRIQMEVCDLLSVVRVAVSQSEKKDCESVQGIYH